MLPDRAPRRRHPGILAGLLLLAQGLAPAQEWRPPVALTTHLIVRVEALGVRSGTTRPLGTGTLESAPGRPGKLTIPLGFPVSRTEKAVAVEVTVDGGSAEEGVLKFNLTSEVSFEPRGPASSHTRRERAAQLAEGGAILHVAYDNPVTESSITLVLTPEARLVPEVVTASAGAPVLFRVAVERLTEGGAQPMEETLLTAMEGSPVSYSVRLASAGALGPVLGGILSPGNAASPGATPGTPPGTDPGGAADQAGADSAPGASSGTGPAVAPWAAAATGGAAPTPAPAEAKSDPASPAETPSPGVLARQGALYDELELTLVPRVSSPGILTVDATLRGRVRGAGGLGGDVLLRKTQAVTNNGTFELKVPSRGFGGAGYRFQVSARF